MSISARRLERERILSLLYEAQIKGVPVVEVIEDLPARPEDFVVETAVGVDEAAKGLDEELGGYLVDWTIERMTTIDRTVLRIGAWELLNRPDLSVAVVISEAVELAKRFSTEESGRFVNGVLATFAAAHRPA